MKYQVDQDTCTTERPVGEEARKHHEFEENELPWDEREELLLPFPTMNLTVPAASTGVQQGRKGDKLRNLLFFGLGLLVYMAFRFSAVWRRSCFAQDKVWR